MNERMRIGLTGMSSTSSLPFYTRSFVYPSDMIHVAASGGSRRQGEVTGSDGSALTALLALELCLWVDKNERLVLLSMLSRRAAKQASISLINTETKLGGCSSRVAALAAEMWRRTQIGIVNRP